MKPRSPAAIPSVAAHAPQVLGHHLPHVGHEGQLLVWHQQPDELVPLVAREDRNLPAWQPGDRCCGSFLGRAPLWRAARNAIREFEDLAHERLQMRRPGTAPAAERVPGLARTAPVASDSGWNQRCQLKGLLRTCADATLSNNRNPNKSAGQIKPRAHDHFFRRWRCAARRCRGGS